MASTLFTNAARGLLKADFDFDTASFKVMLVSSIPTETNLDAWVFRSDVTNEVAGAGYTAGGISQPFTLNAVDTVNNRQSVTFTNIVNGWTGATVTAVGAIIYKDTGSAATDLLFEFIDFGQSVGGTNVNISITHTTDFLATRL